MEMSLNELAIQAVAYLKPLLVATGGAIVADTINDGRKALWAWIKGKLTRPAAQEAIAEVEAAPEEEANWKMLEACLEKALNDDDFREALAAQLAQVLENAGQTQHADVSGDNATVTQIQGDGNSVSIQR